MNLGINNQLFIVCGATAGLANGIALHLLADGAKIIAIGRDEKKLEKFKNIKSDHIETLAGDITKPETINHLFNLVGTRQVHGIVINASGPPAGNFSSITINQWDDAYNSLIRWEVDITKRITAHMQTFNYGRVLYIESASVKQPIDNLVLSNSLRMAIVGMVKTVALENCQSGITYNIIAPGHHNTHAVNRLYAKKAEIEQISIEEAKQQTLDKFPMKRMGEPENFGALGAWILSQYADYNTGQVFYVDGGTIKASL